MAVSQGAVKGHGAVCEQDVDSSGFLSTLNGRNGSLNVSPGSESVMITVRLTAAAATKT